MIFIRITYKRRFPYLDFFLTHYPGALISFVAVSRLVFMVPCFTEGDFVWQSTKGIRKQCYWMKIYITVTSFSLSRRRTVKVPDRKIPNAFNGRIHCFCLAPAMQNQNFAANKDCTKLAFFKFCTTFYGTKKKSSCTFCSETGSCTLRSVRSLVHMFL